MVSMPNSEKMRKISVIEMASASLPKTCRAVAAGNQQQDAGATEPAGGARGHTESRVGHTGFGDSLAYQVRVATEAFIPSQEASRRWALLWR